MRKGRKRERGVGSTGGEERREGNAQGWKDSRPSGGLRYSPDIEMSKPSHHWNCQSLLLPPFPPRSISPALFPPPPPVSLSTTIELSFSQYEASARKMFDSCLSFPARGFITMRLYYQDFKTESIGLSPGISSFQLLFKLFVLIYIVEMVDFAEKNR